MSCIEHWQLTMRWRLNAQRVLVLKQRRGGLTRRCRKGGRLEPSAVLFLTKLRTVFPGAPGNSLWALSREPLLRVKSPRGELRALPGGGLRQRRGHIWGGVRSPTGGLLGNQRLDTEREAAPLEFVSFLGCHVFRLQLLALRVRLLLLMKWFGVLRRRSMRRIHHDTRGRGHAPRRGPFRRNCVTGVLRSPTWAPTLTLVPIWVCAPDEVLYKRRGAVPPTESRQSAH